MTPGRAWGSLVVLGLAACAEPAPRVDSISVVVSARSGDVPPPPSGASASLASASPAAPIDPDDHLKQDLLRALEKARVEGGKPKPAATAGPACPASDPLCD